MASPTSSSPVTLSSMSTVICGAGRVTVSDSGWQWVAAGDPQPTPGRRPSWGCPTRRAPRGSRSPSWGCSSASPAPAVARGGATWWGRGTGATPAPRAGLVSPLHHTHLDVTESLLVVGVLGELHPQLSLEGTFARVGGMGAQGHHVLSPDQQVGAWPGDPAGLSTGVGGTGTGTEPPQRGPRMCSRVGGEAEVRDADVVLPAVLQHDVGLGRGRGRCGRQRGDVGRERGQSGTARGGEGTVGWARCMS